MNTPLKAPFPYFGGKSKVADLVWSRLGDVDNYIEPFAGSLAVLLRRPQPGKIETVNDRNHYIVNFWRAVQVDADLVAVHADHPVTEADLHARHEWLLHSEQALEFRHRIASDPEYFDARFAGWWVWGQCCWIGGGWCDASAADKRPPKTKRQMPDMRGDCGAFGKGVVSSAGHNKRPVLRTDAEERGVLTLKKPILNADFDQAGTGVNGRGRPQLGDAYDIGRGVNSNGSLGTCAERLEWLRRWIHRLKDRLRLVRVCYGGWNRVCDSKTTMDRLGLTGVFLDPPYAKNIERVQALIRGESGNGSQSATNRANALYSGDKDQDIDQLVAEVNRWCQKWGQKPKVRIALCGYEGEHNNLVDDHGWSVIEWKAQGGYGNRNESNDNKHRERIWLSPACCVEAQGELF